MVKYLVFDLGGVLIDWSPRYLYQKLFENPEELDFFLKHVCPLDWNLRMDGGISFQQGIRERIQKFPQYSEQIKAYRERWPEMIKGEIFETVSIIRDLHEKGVPYWAITNFNDKTYEYCFAKYQWLNWFSGIIVSGRDYMLKPEPRIYQLLWDRFKLPLEECFFIDDSLSNVIGAREVGMDAVQFTPDLNLRAILEQKRFL